MLPLDKIKAMIKKVVKAEGIELVDVELKGSPNQHILRVFIDREGEINHDDCVLISNRLGPLLDVEDAMQGRYTLEISSPGLTRRLQTKEEFEHFKGRRIKVRTTVDLGGSKNFLGKLISTKGDTIKLCLENSSSIVIPLKLIAKAQLNIEF